MSLDQKILDRLRLLRRVEAMVFLGIVNCGADDRAWLSEGGKELLKLADRGEA